MSCGESVLLSPRSAWFISPAMVDVVKSSERQIMMKERAFFIRVLLRLLSGQNFSAFCSACVLGLGESCLKAHGQCLLNCASTAVC